MQNAPRTARNEDEDIRDEGVYSRPAERRVARTEKC